VDNLEIGWDNLGEEEQQSLSQIQLKVDNGPSIRSVRTQFLKRIVEFAEKTGKSIQFLYYPPYQPN
jgi:hypothetical protein